MSDTSVKIVGEAADIAKHFLGKLLDPATEEGGGILSDTVKFWRFKNKVNLTLKVKEFLEAKGINPRKVLPKTLYPILENGSLEEDDDMQTRWSAMLAHAADPTSPVKVRPSFPEILKQLSPLEVHLLDKFYESVKDKPKDEQKISSIEKAKALKLFGVSSEEYEILVENLFRLGLCQTPSSEGGVTIGEYPVVIRTYDFIKLTPLGEDFIKSCKYS